MKITMYSNYLNHHQLPLCQAFAKLTDNQFTFVATEPISQERLELGYRDMKEPFVLSVSEGEEQKKLAEQLDLESDIVIVGAAPEEYVRNRVKQGKITFRHHERIYRNGRIFALHPGSIHMALTRHNTYCNDPLYLLCAGSYVAGDFAVLGSYIGKTYKWGYFPELIEQNQEHIFSLKQHGKIKLLWVARFIPLKHPELPVKVARQLKQEGYSFELNMIGIGDMIPKIQSMIQQYHLEDCVNLLGSMHPEEVRKHMDEADIFLFTSDQHEGWGAVMNEAMNSCCAVIANDAIGSVSYLVKNGVNGLVYKNGSYFDLMIQIHRVIDDKEYVRQLGWAAFQTLQTEWNAEEAAKRLIVVSEKLNAGLDTPYLDGPLSKETV